MLTREMITVGDQRFRVAPWHGLDGVALLSIPPDQPHPSPSEVGEVLAKVSERGYSRVITSALNASDSEAFLALGFVENDRLHVLEHTLGSAGSPATSRRSDERATAVVLRRGRRSDRGVALEIDSAAFPPFWRLDAPGLADAKNATPSSRFRIALLDGRPVGYSVTGRGGTSGFLQRLATDPHERRRGVATSLVHDAIRWCERKKCDRVLVNTQRSNDAALALYDSLGFVRTPEDLVVLSWTAP